MTKSVVLLSGGLDSSTALAVTFEEQGPEILALSINYNQRHLKEIECARQVAQHYGIEHLVLNIPLLGLALKSSALTSNNIDVPEGHYTDESMRATVVPNRNAILLSLATAIAVDRGARRVVYAAHAGDHAIYPDCRPEFFKALNLALRIGNEGFAVPAFHLHAPFISLTKAQIVEIGDHLCVPFEATWSCYNGRELHCGKCGTCVERQEAFRDADITDPTHYEGEVGEVAHQAVAAG